MQDPLPEVGDEDIDERVDGVPMPPQRDRHASGGQAGGIRLAFVAEHVEAGDGDICWRQPTEVLREQGETSGSDGSPVSPR